MTMFSRNRTAVLAPPALPARPRADEDPGYAELAAARVRLRDLETELSGVDMARRAAVAAGDEVAAVAAARRLVDLPSIVAAARNRIAVLDRAVDDRTRVRVHRWELTMLAAWLEAWEARCAVFAAAYTAAVELADVAACYVEVGYPLETDPDRLMVEFRRVGETGGIAAELSRVRAELAAVTEGAGS